MYKLDNSRLIWPLPILMAHIILDMRPTPMLHNIQNIPKGVSTFSGIIHVLNFFLKSFIYPNVIEWAPKLHMNLLYPKSLLSASSIYGFIFSYPSIKLSSDFYLNFKDFVSPVFTPYFISLKTESRWLISSEI